MKVILIKRSFLVTFERNTVDGFRESLKHMPTDGQSEKDHITSSTELKEEISLYLIFDAVPQ